MRQSRVIVNPLRRKVVRLFSASLMSNTKWRKMLVMLDRSDVGLRQAIIKYIDDEAEHVIYAPDQEHLRRMPLGYIDLGQGPFAFSLIEWLEYPAVAIFERPAPNGTGRLPALEVTQDLDKTEALIRKLGQYPLERTARGLRINGYIRQS